MKIYGNIIDFYVNNGIKIRGDYENIYPYCIGFTGNEINKIVLIFKNNNILISGIEVFKNYEYYPPDIYYSGYDLTENYDLINIFLNKYNTANNNLLFVINFENEELNKDLILKLKEKYGPIISEEEKQERKNNGWEFID